MIDVRSGPLGIDLSPDERGVEAIVPSLEKIRAFWWLQRTSRRW
jgi:hypothetical protein